MGSKGFFSNGSSASSEESVGGGDRLAPGGFFDRLGAGNSWLKSLLGLEGARDDWGPLGGPVCEEQVGLVIRGKPSEQDQASPTNSHADAIRSSGEPVGFFAEVDDPDSYAQEAYMDMKGLVADPAWFEANRPAYLDADQAQADEIVSTLCTIDVSQEQADAFDSWWDSAALDPGRFDIVGGNCSSHAAEAFGDAGMLEGGIDGFDTPENLYAELKERYGDAMQCESGYVGFNQDSDGNWSHEVRPAAQDSFTADGHESTNSAPGGSNSTGPKPARTTVPSTIHAVE